MVMPWFWKRGERTASVIAGARGKEEEWGLKRGKP